MDINVNVKISLSEDTVKLLAAFLGSGTVQSGTKETPVAKLEKPAKTEKPAKEEKPAGEGGSGAAQSGGDDDVEAMRVKIRTKVVSLRDSGKKEDTVKLMAEYGITQLSKLPEDKLTEFLDKLNAVK